MRRVVLVAMLAAATGCPKPAGKAGPNGPEIPTNFTPPPALGAEPKANAEALGHAWLELIHPRFHDRWADSFLEDCRVYLPPENALNDDKLAAVVAFDVKPDGALAGAKVAQSSGNHDFDATALEMVTESAPFPAPPADLLSDDGVVHASWLFARDVRQDGLAGAAVDKRLWEASKAVPSLLAKGRIADAAQRVAVAAQSPDAAPALVGLARDVAGAVLETALGDDEAETRIAAALAIGDARWTAAIPRLRTLATEAPDLRLQKAAITALGELGDAEAEPVLLATLDRVDGDRSAAAAVALAALGKGAQVWERVGPKIKDSDARVRAAALATVADLGEPTSVDGLAAVLADRKANRQDRAAAAAALGAATGGDAEGPAAKALVAALTDGDATVRAAAARAVAAAGAHGTRGKTLYYKVEPLLKDRDPRARAAAALAAARVWPQGAAADVAMLSHKDRDAGVQQACAEGLAEAPGPEALAALLTLAKSDNTAVQLTALTALSTRQEPEAHAALTAVATSGDPGVRALAAAAETDRSKLESFLADPAPEVRAAALRTYVKLLGTAAALPKAMPAVAAGAGPREQLAPASTFLSATNPPAATR